MPRESPSEINCHHSVAVLTVYACLRAAILAFSYYKRADRFAV